MMYYYDSFSPFHMFGWGFLGPVFMILFWGLIIYGIVLVFKGSSSSGDKNKALDILKERYAKGEITKEQFEVMKKDLQ